MERRDFLKIVGESGLAGLALALTGCEDALFGPSDVTAVKVLPLPDFKRWWDEISACSGRSGDFERIRWFHVQEQYIPCIIDGQRKMCDGIWKKPHDIYLSNRVFDLYNHGPGTIGYKNAERKVKNEMLHDLLQDEGHGHPPIFKQCGVD